MTALDAKLRLGLAAAVPLAFALGWAHGLRTPGELLPSLLAAGVLVPLAALLAGMLATLLLSVALLGPFTLRESTVEAANVVFEWGGWLLAVAALTFGVVAVGARLAGPSAPPDLRLWALVGQVGRGAGAVALGWLVLASLLEVRRRVTTSRDLRAARALVAAGRAEAALDRCEAGRARWEDRPLVRVRAAVDLAALRAALLAPGRPDEAAAAFADLAEQVSWSPDRVDVVARAADGVGLPGAGLQAWMLAIRLTPDARDRALSEVGRRAAALGDEGADGARRAAVLVWAREEAVRARGRGDRSEVEALAALAERLGAAEVAREVRGLLEASA